MSLQGGIFGQRAAQSSQGGALRELALFSVGEVLCGVDLQGVQEVLAAPPPAPQPGRGGGEAGSGVIPLPEAPLFVEGVINLRGQTLPLVDLRKRFGLTEEQSKVKSHPPQAESGVGVRGTVRGQESREGRRSERSRVLVIRIAGQPRGFLVDAVAGILRVPAASVEPPPLLGKQSASYLQGVARRGDRLVLLLDLEQVLTREDQIRLSEALEGSQKSGVRSQKTEKASRHTLRASRKAASTRGVKREARGD